MAFKYVNRYMSLADFEKDPARWELDVMYPQAEHDTGTLWHLNNMLMDWNMALHSFAAHWNILNETDKEQYAATIAHIVRMFDPARVNAALDVMPIYLLMWFVQYIVPEYHERFQEIYMQKDLNQYLLDSVTANAGIPTEIGRDEHAAAVKELLAKYGPANWQEVVPAETAVKVLQQIYKEEVQAVQTAAVAAEKMKNAKIIGVLIVGVFGIFAITRIRPRRKAA